MLSAPIFNICEVERIALTILFRFNAMADKRHSSVTAGMPLFLILARQRSRLSREFNSLRRKIKQKAWK